MAFTIRKATKAKAKLRAALFGPSGSGKTFTALRIAAGIASRTGQSVGLIDSEHGSASKYSDRFEFLTGDLERKSIEEYCEAMRSMAREGVGVLVIDSLSHAWQELLEEIDQLSRSKYKGNSWGAWREGTPKQRQLVEAILTYPGHVIATMRSKTEWDSAKDDRGKSQIVRLGLAPEQGKGIEYEFDLLMEINQDHIGTITKDRTGRYQDQIVSKPGEDFGAALAEWLEDGTEPAPRPEPRPEPADAPEPEGDPGDYGGGPRHSPRFEDVIDGALSRWHAFEPMRGPGARESRKAHLLNGLVSRAVKAGAIVEAAISNDNGKRNASKAWKALESLWREHPRRLESTVAAYLNEKFAALEAAGQVPAPEAPGEPWRVPAQVGAGDAWEPDGKALERHVDALAGRLGQDPRPAILEWATVNERPAKFSDYSTADVAACEDEVLRPWYERVAGLEEALTN